MRNAEASQARILDAAFSEFATYGMAGARIDRIAATAGCNKNLIYIYFESKEALFATVLKKHVSRVYEELHFTPENLPEFAGRVMDFSMANPDLMRLLAWFGLERKVENPSERITATDDRVAALKRAQNAGEVGTAFPAAFLLTAILSVSTAWTAASPFSIEGSISIGPRALRRHVVDAVRLLTAAE